MTPTSKSLTPRQRLEGLKALVRHKSHQGKILTGKVSEERTEFKNLLKSDIPKTHSECEERLRALQARWDAIDAAKEKVADFKTKHKEAEYQLLFEDITQGDQLELDGTEVQITMETIKHVQAAIVTVQTEEDDRGEDDVDIKHPRPDTVELESLEATLDAWLEAEGLDTTELASEAKATHPDEVRKPPKRKKAKAEAAPEIHHDLDAANDPGLQASHGAHALN